MARRVAFVPFESICMKDDRRRAIGAAELRGIRERGRDDGRRSADRLDSTRKTGMRGAALGLRLPASWHASDRVQLRQGAHERFRVSGECDRPEIAGGFVLLPIARSQRHHDSHRDQPEKRQAITPGNRATSIGESMPTAISAQVAALLRRRRARVK